MSNLNIILKSNKCEFTNFFREPVIIPANSEVALVKGNITVPVFSQQKLTIPALTAGAERATNWITVTLDGVRELFSWTDLYTAFALFLDGLDQNGALVTADNFFSGNYSFFLNNPIWAENTNVANIQEKTGFNEVFAKMLNTRYKFYSVGPKVFWERTEPEIISGITTLNPNWGANTQAKSFPAAQKQWGITAEYEPSWAIAAVDESPLTLLPADNTVWNTAVGAQWTSAGAGTLGTYDNIYINTENPIDPNGGWLGFQYNSQDNTSFVGLSIQTGNCNTTLSQNVVLPTAADPSIVDIGFKFTEDASGNNTYQIVDGHSSQSIYNGVSIVTAVSPNLFPSQSYHSFDNDNDYFYIQIARAGIVSPSEFKYTVTLYRHDGGKAAVQPSTTGVMIYQTTHTLASPMISATPIFLSDGVGNVIRDVAHIAALPQSFEQGKIASSAPSYQGAIVIEPNIVFPAAAPIKTDVLEFQTILGLEAFQDDPLMAVNAFNDDSNIAKNSKLIMDWMKPIQILDKDCDKYVGIRNPNKIYNYLTAPHYGLQTNPLNLTTSLPRMLDVSILDSTLKNISGACPATSILGVAQNTFETSTIDRIVGTIPTDLEADKNNNFDWILDYEPFTPVYRPLNNPIPLNVSQMLIEVSYRDFQTGQKRSIETIDGTLNLELHIRPSRKPPPVTNNIRPF